MRNAAGRHWTLLLGLLGACSSPPPSPTSPIGKTIDDQEWYEVVSQRPGPEVTDATMRRKIEESGQPWKVRDRATGIEMVLVLPGEFLMGSPESEPGRNADEGPQHRVRLTKAFYLGATEVTQAQWRRVLGSSQGFFKGDNKPADGCWDDLQAFLSKANVGIRAGVELLRAPTEAEWDYACRAGTTGLFNFEGPISHALVNFNDGVVKSPYVDGKLKVVNGRLEVEWETLPSPECRMSTAAAGSLPPNAWGLHEMHGNLREWTADKYVADAYSGRGPVAVDPFVRAVGDEARTLRGGDWYKNARQSRSAVRQEGGTDTRSNRIGFRVARTLASHNGSTGRLPDAAIQATAVLAGHTDKVGHAAFSPDGNRIVTSSTDGTARLWDSDGKPLAVLDGDVVTVRSALFSPDGSRIAVLAASEEHAVRLWDSGGKPLAVLAGHTNTVRSAVFSPDGKRIVTASVDSTARLWDNEGQSLAVLADHTKSVELAVFSPDGSRIVTTSVDGTTRVWDSEGKSLDVFADERVGAVTFSPDGSRIITYSPDSADGIVRLWDREWKEIAVLAGHTSVVRSVGFSPDGSRIVTGSLDHTARLWDGEGKVLAVLVGHTDKVRHAAFSPDGNSIVTASDDRTARQWDKDGKPLAVFAGHMGRLNHAAYSPDSSRIVTTSEDGTARLFRVLAKKHKSATGPSATAAPARLRFKTEVRSILEDSKGNYWFGSWSEGVARFDGERLTYFTEEDGLSNNQARTILEGRNGVIWFEGGKGISSYDGERIITHTARDYTSKDAWQLRAGDLWFKEDGEGVNELEGKPGVYRYDGETFTYLAFPLPEDRLSDYSYSVTGAAKGKGGRLWFATYRAVIGYDGKSFTIIDDKSLGLNEDTGWLHTRCVFEDSKGRLWIGNNGIGVFLRDGDTTINFTQEKGLCKRDQRSGGKMAPRFGDVSDGSASLHRVFSIGEDRAGNIWFGTVGNGAWRYDGESVRNFTEADGLTSKNIPAIYKDRRGDLWLGGEGVFKFNGESFDRIH